MEKLKAYILIFLAFCVLSSKNIIIYNEETLVALSFLAFVFFISHYYGNTIQESLNERGDGIKIELQNLGLGRLESLDHLFKEHKKVSALNEGINSIILFTLRELASATSRGGAALNSNFAHQMEQKLKTLSLSKITIQQKLQKFMAADVLGLVHVYSKRANKHGKITSFNPKQIGQAIQIISGN